MGVGWGEGRPDPSTSLYLLWQEPLRSRQGSCAFVFMFSFWGFSQEFSLCVIL